MTNTLLTLLSKEITVESRAKETITSQIGITIILAMIIGLGIQNAFLTQNVITRLFPLFLWFSFFCVASITGAKIFESERTNNALGGLIIAGVPAALIFISKAISLSLILFITLLSTILFLSITLNVDIFGTLISLIFVSTPVVIGTAALISLLGLLSFSSKLQGTSMLLILLPLLFPLLFAAIELTTQVQAGVPSFFFSPFLALLIFTDLIYLLLGILLFDKVLNN